MGWGWVQTQGDLGLGGVGYFPVRTQYGLRADFVARPNRVGGWVHIWTQEGLGVGHSESGPKMGLGPSLSGPKMGLGPSLSGPNMGWGLTLWLDPMGLGAGCMSGPKGVGFGFESFRVQTQYGLGWGVGPNLMGFGSFPVRTPNGLG